MNLDGRCYMGAGAYPGAPVPESESWSFQSGLQDLPKGAKTQRWSKRRSSKRRLRKRLRNEECGESTRSLVEVFTGTVNSVEEFAQEWDDIELLVDSVASATVVGDEMVRAVRATDPNPNANYRLADVSNIPNNGLHECCRCNRRRLPVSAEGVCDGRG